ncbi:hypothetical protein M8C21_030871, partial [Ambrosia artemisiifolia]
MVAPSSGSNSLKEYLKRYQNNNEEEKKKKKNKSKTKSAMNGGIVVDEDPVWQKPVEIEEEDYESQDEEMPQVDEDIEVKRMRKLEQIKAQRPFGSIYEDGSGWVSVSDNAKNLTESALAVVVRVVAIYKGKWDLHMLDYIPLEELDNQFPGTESTSKTKPERQEGKFKGKFNKSVVNVSLYHFVQNINKFEWDRRK